MLVRQQDELRNAMCHIIASIHSIALDASLFLQEIEAIKPSSKGQGSAHTTDTCKRAGAAAGISPP
jgi:hypothetical protein